MENNFQKMLDRAVDIRNKYSKTDPKQWQIEQVFMGMIKDVGNLSKLLMINSGYRNDIQGDVKEKIKHELSDVLFSIFVLSEKLNVDLEKSFWETMNEIEKKIN